MTFLNELNQKQREAALQTEGPVLIVAGAGAGKTKTITYRIFHLIKSGVSPERILAITFTNKAAREMRERVEKLCMGDPEAAEKYKAGIKPFINTFHALGSHIIKQNCQVLGLPRFFSISDKSDAKKIVKEILVNKGYDPKQHDPAKILNAISNQKGKGVTAEEFADSMGNEFSAKLISSVWLEYESVLKKEKTLDLDDLLLVAMQLLRKNEKVRQYYQNLWQYIHIDEYQDTNTVQYRIARLLSDSHKNICVVGDADQNIYSWRGADISNILRFEKDFPGCKVVLLEENYRSTKTIIDSANQIIKKNKQRIEKNLFTQKDHGEKIGVFEGWSELQEAYFVAHRARTLIEKGISPDEIAVLYRANFQSRTLEEAFMGLGIPYAMIGTKFFERKEVKDILSFIRAALNRDSWIDIGRIINVPARGIGGATLEKLRLGSAEKIAPATRRKVEVFFTFLDKIAEHARTQRPSETIKFVLKESGIEDMFKKGNDEDMERFENLMELVTLATRYDDLPPGESIEIFLGDAALAAQEETPEERQAAVKLMTVHSAKGLEFDYVFITGLEQGLFPHERMGGGAHDNEEERRLFYVAITRARKKI
ncbi:MAG TPA: UvrD-helicase domain-containing protein, partial [Candidatus Nanoarchaeia archaeon]|nr:UvrD-helicase domain-containing protein [Candidatus Nanoarchaeia archaeon]